MNEIVKKGFKMLFTHIISVALTLFFMLAFGWLINKWGFYPFSIIMMLFYIGLFYSDGWNWGRREGRSYSKVKSNPLRAAAASAIPSSIPLIFAVLVFLQVQIPVIPVDVIIKIWYFPFIGFFTNPENISYIEILLPAAVIPIISMLGYFTGSRNFSLLEKIAYKKRKQKK